MDREKVIKDLESIISRDPLDAPGDLIDETLTLPKEQEAVKPKSKVRHGANAQIHHLYAILSLQAMDGSSLKVISEVEHGRFR